MIPHLRPELLQVSYLRLPRERTVGLQQRVVRPEIMDQSSLHPALHVQALRGLARTNYWGSTRRLIWNAVRQIAHSRKLDEIRILDVASGAGDLAIWLARKARCERLRVEVEGCDNSDVAVQFAQEKARSLARDKPTFFRCDVLKNPIEKRYDFVVCSLFLHHLSEQQSTSFLTKAAAVARHAVLVDDLRRSRMGYALARIGCAILTRSAVVHVDAPRSVQAAYNEHEAQELFRNAGLSGARVRRHWPQRYLITWEKPSLCNT